MNDKYHRIIWRCNHKFDSGEKCTTPHVDEETIKGLFVKVANIIFEERDGIAEDFNDIRELQYGIAELETERARLQEKLNVEVELIQKRIDENARIALDQTEYQKRYNGLVESFDGTKEQLDTVTYAITEKQV